MTAAGRFPAGVLIVGLVLTAVAAAAAATSPFVDGSLPVVVIGVSVLLPFLVAAAIRVRYPERLLGDLLLAVGAAYFVRSLAAVDSSGIYAVARALGQFSEVLLIWLMLAFPVGRLARPWSLTIVVAGGLSILLLWLPVVLFSPEIPTGGVFVPCGSDCPDNALLISDEPALGDTLLTVFRAVAATLILATAGVLWTRLRRATPLMRRILTPVVIASIVRTLAVAALFLALGSPGWVRGLLVVSYWAIPISIIVGLLRARAYDAAALERLVHGLRSRPAPGELRAVVADALGDPTLEIAYWLPEAATYVGDDGYAVTLPRPHSGRAVTRVAAPDGEPVAVLMHDPALLDHPELLEALSSTAAIALETSGLETAVAAARAGTISAVDAERRRIERDLHDGAQQRLIALRMKVSVAERLLDRDAERAQEILDELGGDVEAALDDVRSLAHGIVPPALVERGLPAALAAAGRDAPVPVAVHADAIGRFPPEVETAVYFCCLEALQNVGKHAGPGAAADVRLIDEGDRLTFVIADDGHGRTSATSGDGAGLRNIRERVTELGGSVAVTDRPDGGTEVRGSVPLPT